MEILKGLLYAIVISLIAGALMGGVIFGLPIYFCGVKTGLIIGGSIISFSVFLFFTISMFRGH